MQTRLDGLVKLEEIDPPKETTIAQYLAIGLMNSTQMRRAVYQVASWRKCKGRTGFVRREEFLKRLVLEKGKPIC